MSTFDTINVILLLVIILALVWILTEFTALRKELGQSNTGDPDTLKVRLQAYERLTLVAERISLPHVLSRTANAGHSARQMQGALIDAIRQEYDYNTSQQIYVTPEIWKAVTNLKEQNIYIINQLASTMPSNATGLDLNKQIIDFLINHPKSSLHSIVLEAIAYDAKKLM